LGGIQSSIRRIDEELACSLKISDCAAPASPAASGTNRLAAPHEFHSSRKLPQRARNHHSGRGNRRSRLTRHRTGSAHSGTAVASEISLADCPMALCVAAYGFLVSERSLIPPSDDKTPLIQAPRRSPGLSTPRIRRSEPNVTSKLQSQSSVLSWLATSPDACPVVLVANEPTCDTVDLGVTKARRSALLPEVPTIAEAGVAGFDFPIWYGIWATAGTPAAVVDKLSKDIARVIAGGHAGLDRKARG
jgi:hypothetical protein